MSKLSTVREFLSYLRITKKWWLAPIIFFLIVLGAFMIFSKGSAVAPYIYVLF